MSDLIQYRPFRNSDPPLLAEVWRSQLSQRGLMQPMSASLLERLVLSKPIFDREGLIVAMEEDHAVGFAHAGFGPTEDRSHISTARGVVSMLMVRASDLSSPIASELLIASEAYLQSHGAKTLYAGGVDCVHPFYLGLYGGSRLAGILRSDERWQQFYLAHGYQEVSRSLVLHVDLSRFRPVIDHQQMQLRRRINLHILDDPAPRTWWEAATFGQFTCTRFELRFRDTGALAASAMAWDMEPLSTTWGVHAAGLVELDVTASNRKSGVATYLLGEILRHLSSQAVALVEVQIPSTNVAALALFRKHGFTEVDQSIVYRKECVK